GHANHYRENTATPQQQHRRDSPVAKWIHDNFSDRNKTIDIL
ncbi:unnamed protein product, partial [Rotaria magnacalcarata]